MCNIFFSEVRVDGAAHCIKFALAFLDAAVFERDGLVVLFGHKIFEAEFFKLHAQPPHIQAVGKRRKDVKRFAGNFFLFFFALELQCLHIMQAVG